LPQGRRLEAKNVSLVPLPFFDSLPGFFRALPGVLAALWSALGWADLVNLRVPTPAGAWAFVLARLRRRPVFLLVVGDLAGVAGSVPADSLKRRLFHEYVRLEERLLQEMVNRSLAITNGRALYEKHARPGKAIYETRNSTLSISDVAPARETYQQPSARLLCVSRIDPRKGLRYLPAAMAILREHGFEPSLNVIGPTVGRIGQQEKEATLQAARGLGLADAIRFRGPASLSEVYSAYREHDLLLVPSLPGEGIPRVLLEAMAAGLPLVATSVAGIPDLVADGHNGLLVPPFDGDALGRAAARLLEEPWLREACVRSGYATARKHTAEAQAARITDVLRMHFGGRSRDGLSASRHPRVTIPLVALNLSGGVKSLMLLANRMAERGAAVRLLVPDYAAVPPVQLDPAVELRVLRTRGPGRLCQLEFFLSLARESAADADVVLANYFLTAYPVVLSWLLHGRRAVLAYNVRGYEPWSHGLMAPSGMAGRYLRFGLAWLSYRLPLTKLVTTEWLRRMVADRQALVVGHGIDLETFSASDVGCQASDLGLTGLAQRSPVDRAKAEPGNGKLIVVGAIGRLGAVKGYADFLSAASSLPSELPIKFLVARADAVPLPDGHLAEPVEARTEDEMAIFYRRCDVFVFPSLAEGFGLPALEAMACGCAVVATDCGGVSSFARPSENCLMVPPAHPELLCEAIARLCREPELRARLARAGVETARGFDRRAALDRLVDAVFALAPRR